MVSFRPLPPLFAPRPPPSNNNNNTQVFLPASDIAKYVAEGDVDMGITGEDIIAESQVDVVTLQALGFGKCELAVQAPVGQYKDPAELAGKRIVTSFPNLARKFFSQYDASTGEETSVKYVSGSVEVACSLGLADGVIDLVETVRKVNLF